MFNALMRELCAECVRLEVGTVVRLHSLRGTMSTKYPFKACNDPTVDGRYEDLIINIIVVSALIINYH